MSSPYRICGCETKSGDECKNRLKSGEKYCHIHRDALYQSSPRAGAGAGELSLRSDNLPACKIFTIHKNRSLFNAFKKKAEQQSRDFIQVFPWKIDNYLDSYVMFVAATDVSCISNPKDCDNVESVICGWITAMIEKDEGAVYLSQITSQSAVHKDDSRFMGVAKRLFVELVSWCENNNKSFIYLFPLNDKVRSIYRKWGFYDHGKYQYMDIKNSPSKKWFQKQRDHEEKQIKEEIKEQFDTVAKYTRKSQKKTLYKVQQEFPDVFEQLLNTVQYFESMIDELSDEDQELEEDEIREYIADSLAPYSR